MLAAPAVKAPQQATWARGLLAVAIIAAVWLRAHAELGGLGQGLFALPLAWVLAGLLVGWMLGDEVESAASLWLLSLLPMLSLSLTVWPLAAEAAGWSGAPVLPGGSSAASGPPLAASIARLSSVALLAHLAAHLHLWCALRGGRPGWGDWVRQARATAVLVGLVAFGCLAVDPRWLGPFELAGVALTGSLLWSAFRMSRLGRGVGLMPRVEGTDSLRAARTDRLRGLGLVWQIGASVVLAVAIAHAQVATGPVLIAFWTGSAGFSVLLGLRLLERRRQRAGQMQRAGREAFEAARRYRHVYYSAPVGLMSASPEGFLLRWNDQAGRLFAGRLIHGQINSLAAVLGAEGLASLLESLARGAEHRVELHAAEGRVLDCEAVLVDGCIELSLIDVTERSRLGAAYEHMAFHDSLTELLNRRGLERHVGAALAAQAEGSPVCLLWLDLDRFKSINEVFGHAAGDAVIVEVARRLGPGADDMPIGRVGGDEFLVLLPGQALAAARLYADRLLVLVTGEPFSFEGARFDVAASIGVVEATTGMSVGELMAQADHACRQAKAAGTGRILGLRTSERSLDEYRAIVRWGGALHSSLALDRLRLHAQPIVPLRDRAALPGLEVLLRTVDDAGGLEGPARLLAVAERQGSMVAIDRHVLQETIAFCVAHPDLLDRVAFITVNLSGMSLNDTRFLGEAQALLAAHPQVATRLHLEITEAVAVRDIRSTRRFVERMRELGVGVALDDFGAGYTSFAYLRDIPADMLKIDGQFVLGLGHDVRQRAIISAIQQLASQLGMRTVAEWVEEDATLETLVQLGVDYAQGHLFARAEPFDAWLTRDIVPERAP